MSLYAAAAANESGVRLVQPLRLRIQNFNGSGFPSGLSDGDSSNHSLKSLSQRLPAHRECAPYRQLNRRSACVWSTLISTHVI